jgi:hypothetical protein
MNDIFIIASKNLDRPLTNLNLPGLFLIGMLIFFNSNNYIMPL